MSGRSGFVVPCVTGAAATDGACSVAVEARVDVTAAAERVEVMFQMLARRRRSPMTIKTQTRTGVVEKLVVAGRAGDGSMIGVGETNRPQEAVPDRLKVW